MKIRYVFSSFYFSKFCVFIPIDNETHASLAFATTRYIFKYFSVCLNFKVVNFSRTEKTQYTLAAECTSTLKTVNIPTWLAHTELASERVSGTSRAKSIEWRKIWINSFSRSMQHLQLLLTFHPSTSKVDSQTICSVFVTGVRVLNQRSKLNLNN